MKKIIYLLSLFSFIAFAGFSQNRDPNNTLLWEVSGKKLKKPSYLFGTYHFIGKNFIDSMGVLKGKLNNTEGVVGELVMDDKEIAKLAPYMMSDTTLDKVLTPEEYEKVNSVLKSTMKMDLQYFKTMKPMAINVTLLAMFSPVKMPKKNDGLDVYFQNYAKERQRSVAGLETVEEQAKVLFGNSLRKQADALIKMIDDTAKTAKQQLDLYKAYIAQDQNAMLNLFKDSGESPEEMAKLLDNRNKNWLAKLPDMMTDKPLFIAVGAGHLFGKAGLIEGLRKQGYQVKPVKTN